MVDAGVAESGCLIVWGVLAGCSGDYGGVRGPWWPIVFTSEIVALFPLEIDPLW